MTETPPTDNALLRTDLLTLHDGVYYADNLLPSAYRARWDDEAADDPVQSAIATRGEGKNDLATLTAKIGPLWASFPENRRVETVLDVGVGYGRIELYLSAKRGLTCQTLCAVDISETMLRLLLANREEHDVFPGASVNAICSSASELPLADDSIDLALSSALFLHMGKRYVGQALAEIARVLKPGGSFIFDSSFPNRRNPDNYVPQLKPERLRKPHALKYWTRQEIERLIVSSGLAAKAGAFRLEASSYAIAPKRVGPIGVPLARRLNAALGEPRTLRDVLTVSYSAVSANAFS
jgi:arsenite methyltransferase